MKMEMILGILRMENGSQWREVVWGLKSLSKSGRKVARKHHESWWGGWLCREKEEREEREIALKITWCKMNLRQINYLAEN